MSRRFSVTLIAGFGLALAACGGTGGQPAATSDSAQATPPGATATPGGADVNAAGDIPDTQAFVSFTLPSGTFSVKVPEGWVRTETAGAVTFAAHFNSVRLATMPVAAAPTVTSAGSTEAAAITRQGANVAIGTISTVTRSGGTAILITYQADSAADPVTGRSARLDVQRYEFWRNGTEAVLTLSAPAGADNVDPWQKVTDSFQWR